MGRHRIQLCRFAGAGCMAQTLSGRHGNASGAGAAAVRVRVFNGFAVPDVRNDDVVFADGTWSNPVGHHCTTRGFVLCLVAAIIVGYGSSVALRGKAIWINWDRISARLVLCLAFLILVGWGFKMAHGLIAGTLPLNG